METFVGEGAEGVSMLYPTSEPVQEARKVILLSSTRTVKVEVRTTVPLIVETALTMRFVYILIEICCVFMQNNMI